MECLNGARWVADEILAKHPELDVRVLAVWQAIKGDGLGTGHGEDILADHRVTHLYDPDLAIGTWFGDRDPQVHAGQGLAWDAYVLFDADADATQLTSHILESGRPIYVQRHRLQGALGLEA